MKSVLSFFDNIWKLLVFTIAANLACLNDWIFLHLGALIYVPALASMVALLVFFVLHLHFRATLDEYISSGWFASDFWNVLTPAERVRWTFATIIALMVCIAIIAAGVGK